MSSWLGYGGVMVQQIMKCLRLTLNECCCCRLFPGQQSPIFDGVINNQVTPLNLSENQTAEAKDNGLAFAIQLLHNRYLHWAHHKEPGNVMYAE
jgi:hypothetical protein